MADASKYGFCTPKSDAIMCLKSIRVATCISIYGKKQSCDSIYYRTKGYIQRSKVTRSQEVGFPV